MGKFGCGFKSFHPPAACGWGVVFADFLAVILVAREAFLFGGRGVEDILRIHVDGKSP
jgi:hypothetical protein